MISTYADQKYRRQSDEVYAEYPPGSLSDWDQFEHGPLTPPLPPVTRMLPPPARCVRPPDVSIPHQGNTYDDATVCAPPTTPQHKLSGISSPHVHYNYKHPPATGGTPTLYCYRKSDNFMRHPTGTGPVSLQNQENIRPTYPHMDEAPSTFTPAAASGEPPVTSYPPTYEASRPSWYQQTPPVPYDMPGTSVSLNAYGNVNDESTHFIPGDVQPRPLRARLQPYNNTTVGELPYYSSPPRSTSSYFAAARRPGIMDSVRGK